MEQKNVSKMSCNIKNKHIEKIKQLFPEVVSEGKVDFEKLKASLGKDTLADRDSYKLTWAGKEDVFKVIQKQSSARLSPCQRESINFADSENLFIEGENLEVLKLIQKSYMGKIKLIYIDPPYNTGNQFIYEDDYTDGIENYLKITGQMDEEGNHLSTNTEKRGRYHSNWLNMMYPRLFLARQLLRDDGIIFVSIDNNEVHNLITIMNEIFGEENFITCIANVSNPKGRSDDKYVPTAHEYVLLYKKNEPVLYGWEPGEHIIRRYNKTDEDGRNYREIDLRKTGSKDKREDRPNLFYYFLYNKDTGDFYPTRSKNIPEGYIQIKPLRNDGSDGRWRWELETAKNKINKLIPKLMQVRGVWTVFEKDYLDERDSVKPTSAWTGKEFNSERGSEAFIDLGFEKEVFPYPKPVGFIKRIIEFGTSDDDIILDFFAGSCTTAQAVLEQNQEDNGNRQFIMVQFPEPTPEDSVARQEGYDNIAEIGKERIRRVINGCGKDSDSINDGFKVFKLTSSVFKQWESLEDENVEKLKEQMELFDNMIEEDASKEDVIFEVLLKQGFDLNSDIINTDIDSNNVYKIINKSESQDVFYICLDDKINDNTLEELGLTEDDVFICLDSAMTDEQKVNISMQARLEVI